MSVNSPELLVVGLVGLVLWLVPGLALTKAKINSGELTDKYPILSKFPDQHPDGGRRPKCNQFFSVNNYGKVFTKIQSVVFYVT